MDSRCFLTLKSGVHLLEKPTFKPYRLPSGGWGSALSVGNILRREACWRAFRSR